MKPCELLLIHNGILGGDIDVKDLPTGVLKEIKKGKCESEYIALYESKCDVFSPDFKVVCKIQDELRNREKKKASKPFNKGFFK